MNKKLVLIFIALCIFWEFSPRASRAEEEGALLGIQKIADSKLEEIRGGAASRLQFLLETRRIILWDEADTTNVASWIHQEGTGNRVFQGLSAHCGP